MNEKDIQIVDRTIVVRKTRDYLFLGAHKGIELCFVSGAPSEEFTLTRVTEYGQQTGTLRLKVESGRINEDRFIMSSEANQNILPGLHISHVIIEQQVSGFISPAFILRKRRKPSLETTLKKDLSDIPERVSSKTILISLKDFIFCDKCIKFDGEHPGQAN